jgi:type II secretory pathway component PulM
VSETAQASGIVVDRYAIEEDAVDLTIAETDASTLYAWLGALSERHGVVVREGTVRALGESGRVTARLTLGRSG